LSSGNINWLFWQQSPAWRLTTLPRFVGPCR